MGIVFTENDYIELPEKVWLHYSTNIGGKNYRIIGTYPLKFPRHFVLKSATVGTDLIGDTFNSFATLKNGMRSCQCDDTYSTRRKEVNLSLLHGWRHPAVPISLLRDDCPTSLHVVQSPLSAVTRLNVAGGVE